MRNTQHNQKEELAEIFDTRYYEAVCDLGVKYVEKIIIKIFIDSGVWGLLNKRFYSASELINEKGYMPSRKFAFEWMLRFLVNNNCISFKCEHGNNLYKATTKEVLLNIDKLRSAILDVDKNLLSSCEYMEYISNYYLDFFKGKVSGYEILFVKDKMRLWNRYFGNENSGYVVYNQLGALGLKNWVSTVAYNSIII